MIPYSAKSEIHYTEKGDKRNAAPKRHSFVSERKMVYILVRFENSTRIRIKQRQKKQ